MTHMSRETKKQNFILGWFQNEDAAGSRGWSFPTENNDGVGCTGFDATKRYVYRHSVH